MSIIYIMLYHKKISMSDIHRIEEQKEKIVSTTGERNRSTEHLVRSSRSSLPDYLPLRVFGKR